jgi:Mg2+ and Co2+ transporter CorA
MSERVQAVADAAQAAYFRAHLQQDHSDLSTILAKQTHSLTRCVTEGNMRPMSDIRRHIRTIERELQSIDRMLEALDDRFPEMADVVPARRQA